MFYLIDLYEGFMIVARTNSFKELEREAQNFEVETDGECMLVWNTSGKPGYYREI